MASRELVEYDGEEFSVLERPSPTSAAVTAAKERMLGGVDLRDLAFDVVKVGKLLCIAYNGVAGNTELQIQVREISLEVARLCSSASLVIFKLRTAANSILTGLACMYALVLDDLDEVAITVVESLREPDKEMAEEVKKLYVRFSDEEVKVGEARQAIAQEKRAAEREHRGEPAIASLHGAVRALANLSVTMLKIANFWFIMQCEHGSLGGFLSTLNKLQKHEASQRRKLYESKTMKLRAVRMYCFYSARELVCIEYTEQTKETCQELYRYLSENPTFGESRRRIHLLCREFHM